MKLLKLKLFELILPSFKDFMEKNSLQSDTLKESVLQRVYNYRIYSRGSKIHLDKGFLIVDSGGMGGTHWCCFLVKCKKSCYFGSFVGQPDKFLLNQQTKPLINHNCKILLFILFLFVRKNQLLGHQYKNLL